MTLTMTAYVNLIFSYFLMDSLMVFASMFWRTIFRYHSYPSFIDACKLISPIKGFACLSQCFHECNPFWYYCYNCCGLESHEFLYDCYGSRWVQLDIKLSLTGWLMEEGFMGGVHPPLRFFFISDFVLKDTKTIFASVIKIISGIYG